METADIVEEGAEHLLPVNGMAHFGVELDAIDLPLFVGDRGGRAVLAPGYGLEARRHFSEIISVTHPHDAPLGQASEERAGRVELHVGHAVFARGIGLGRHHFTAQMVGDELAAVADAKDRKAQVKDAFCGMIGAFFIDALRAAGENDAVWFKVFDGFETHRIGMHLAVDVMLTDAPRDQLVILPAEIQDQDFFHAKASSLKSEQMRQALLIDYSPLIAAPLKSTDGQAIGRYFHSRSEPTATTSFMSSR